MTVFWGLNDGAFVRKCLPIKNVVAKAVCGAGSLLYHACSDLA